eukprot:1371448-Pyramimonas_sp.AAC.1
MKRIKSCSPACQWASSSRASPGVKEGMTRGGKCVKFTAWKGYPVNHGSRTQTCSEWKLRLWGPRGEGMGKKQQSEKTKLRSAECRARI